MSKVSDLSCKNKSCLLWLVWTDQVRQREEEEEKEAKWNIWFFFSFGWGWCCRLIHENARRNCVLSLLLSLFCYTGCDSASKFNENYARNQKTIVAFGCIWSCGVIISPSQFHPARAINVRSQHIRFRIIIYICVLAVRACGCDGGWRERATTVIISLWQNQMCRMQTWHPSTSLLSTVGAQTHIRTTHTPHWTGPCLASESFRFIHNGTFENFIRSGAFHSVCALACDVVFLFRVIRERWTFVK